MDLPVVILGFGSVGRALTAQIVQNRAYHARHYGLNLALRAVSDSSGCAVAAQDAFTDAELNDLLAHKGKGRSLQDRAVGQAGADPLETVRQGAVPGAVIVDCTASDDTTPALLYSLEASHGIVLANKKPLTQDQATFDRLTRTAEGVQRLDRCRWETTVGAGLPIIATLQRLHACGDTIQGIDGTFSGTLGYVMTGLQAGQPFSDVVRSAHAQGYTEPDPRDDLGGVDVARKALILARFMGLRREMEDVSISGLYPRERDELAVDAFLDWLPEMDGDFQDLVQSASDQDKCLRFVASVSAQSLTVGPQLVPLHSPLGRLEGTDNLIQLRSQWYREQPLVIQGRGAGVEATAAGVLSDIVELGATGLRPANREARGD